MAYTLRVNGEFHTLDVPAERTLLHALRDELGLMGPREACGIGMCGSCTVLAAAQAAVLGGDGPAPGTAQRA